ncbi:Lrp/AsnC family transcriptional regulator [Oceanobacillus neutriphilus]|uniref:ArsR family transcriptional regulator n=1 Tax=Oceanobacillus neutriphilus TaxID=531815 RepID=A0ABQ2NPZ6_9BACI|nr:Lrp/AsnC family transcriptional regulator [Oceanobacillus neutriphilus]GGP07833.1 ArsR family transcriptional regulator [Oceanobacillus neutriphilus]
MKTMDIKIMSMLMLNARASWSQLAAKVGMSGPAIADRVHRLEEKGVIKGYTTLIDPKSVGYEMTAFITLSVNKNIHRAEFLAHVEKLPEIQECHHIAGEDDYMLKVRCKDTRDLDRMISQELRELPGIDKTRTMIVLNSHKDTPIIPMPAEEE